MALSCQRAAEDGAGVHAHCEGDAPPQPGSGDDDVEGPRAQATASYDSMCAGGQPLATSLYCQRVRIMASACERAAPHEYWRNYNYSFNTCNSEDFNAENSQKINNNSKVHLK